MCDATMPRWWGCVVVLAFGVPVVGASAQNDNFDDGVTGSQWTTVIDAPASLAVFELDSQLAVIANAPSDPTTDALYLSNGADGFRMSTAADFTIALDYAFNGFDDFRSEIGDALGLTFGVGRDLDGTDSAAIGFGVSKQSFGGFPVVATALAEGHRIDDVQSENVLNVGGPSSGTFEISYDAAGDDLTLGVGNSTYTLTDTVQGVWGADALYVSFGARGSGFFLFSGDAWLDNFRVVSGQVVGLGDVLVGDYNGSGQVEQGDLDLVLQNWGQDSGGGIAGWISDPPSGQIEQTELDGVLQNWGGTAVPDFRGTSVPEPAALGLVLATMACTRRQGFRV